MGVVDSSGHAVGHAPRAWVFAVSVKSAPVNDDALEQRWRPLHPRLLRYLRVAVGDAAAEDVATDVWIDVARGLARFEGDEVAFRAWVFTIARRRAVDHGRYSARRPATPIDPSTLAEELAGAGSEQEDRDSLAHACAMLARLPKAQAEVVLLRVVGELSVEDTARVMGKRPGAVRVLQHRALRRLRHELERDRD